MHILYSYAGIGFKDKKAFGLSECKHISFLNTLKQLHCFLELCGNYSAISEKKSSLVKDLPTTHSMSSTCYEITFYIKSEVMQSPNILICYLLYQILIYPNQKGYKRVSLGKLYFRIKCIIYLLCPNSYAHYL